MRPKLLMTPLGEYKPAAWNGVNTAGFEPIGDRVLVLPDDAAETTSGNIHLPEEMQERNALAAETGVLIAMGEDAWLWNSDRTRRFEGRKPQQGDRIRFERYSGQVHHAPDGRIYRVMDDKCVAGICTALKFDAKSQQ